MASEWLQNRNKRQVRDTFKVRKLYFKLDIYTTFLRSVTFPYNFYTYFLSISMREVFGDGFF